MAKINMNPHSLYSIYSTPNTAIRAVRNLRHTAMGEQWARISMGAMLYDSLKLHRIWRTGNGKRYVGIVSHWNMNRRFKLEIWGEDIAKLNEALGLQITGSMVFSEPIEIHARMYKGRMFKGIALVENTTFTDTVQTVLTPLAKQSAIETICRYDKRVTRVHSSFDVMLNPVIRVECAGKHKAAIEAAILAYNDNSVTITWKLTGKPAFTGAFDSTKDVTEKIPVIELPKKQPYEFIKQNGGRVTMYMTDDEYDNMIYDMYRKREQEEFEEDMFWMDMDDIA